MNNITGCISKCYDYFIILLLSAEIYSGTIESILVDILKKIIKYSPKLSIICANIHNFICSSYDNLKLLFLESLLVLTYRLGKN